MVSCVVSLFDVYELQISPFNVPGESINEEAGFEKELSWMPALMMATTKQAKC